MVNVNDPRFLSHIAAFRAANNKEPGSAKELLDWVAENFGPLTADFWQEEALIVFGEPLL